MDSDELGHGTQSSSQDPESQKNDRVYRRKAQKLNKELYGELTKNVDLNNRYNRALSILRKINAQNQDLLETLSEINPDAPEIAAAPSVTLTREQEEQFQVLNN